MGGTISADAIRQDVKCGKAGCACRSGNTGHCPAHDDAKPSFSVNVSEDGKVLVCCGAGCSQDAVIAALKERGLWPATGSTAARRAKAVGTRYEVRRVDGELVAVHVRQDRTGGKVMWWETPSGAKGLRGLRVDDLPLYGSERLPSLPDGEPVVLAEGEKVVDSLTRRGVVALGTVCGAAVTPAAESLRPLLGRPVIIWADNDQAGQKHMERVAERLAGLGHQNIRLVAWPDAPERGDAADFDGDEDAVRHLLAQARPWTPPAAVAGDVLLDDVRAFVRRYVMLSDKQADAVALWVTHTHAFEAAGSTPYLQITSPEKRSGKTRLLETLALLAARPWLTGRVTAAVLVRKLARDMATLLLDESDAAFAGEKEYAEALRSTLDNGYRPGIPASLCVKAGGDWDLRDFPVFAPKAIAGIGKLPDTIQDRSIRISLKRRARGEVIEPFRFRDATRQAAPIREMLERWAVTAIASLESARPDIPEALDDRAADGWEPLLAIADLAGGGWPLRARQAAIGLSTGEEREDGETLGVRLLRDIQAIFDGHNIDHISAKDLVAGLVAVDDAPWGDLRGKALTTRGLGWRLRPYGVKAKTVDLEGGRKADGYKADWFSDAWSRYIPAKSLTTNKSLTPDRNDVRLSPSVRLSPGVQTQPPDGQRRCSNCGAALSVAAVRSECGRCIVAAHRASKGRLGDALDGKTT